MARPTENNPKGKQIRQKMTPETVKKLEEVFAIDGTIEEACYYANISSQTYYNWIKEKPELKEQFDRLRNYPVLKARKEVIKGLNNYQNAMDYLKRKKKKEFGDNIDITTEGKALILPQELINKNNINAITQPTEKNSNIDEKI